MNIIPFYELRQRLYSTAAAGCQTISEDFRLKKAYEAFEPLSAANKAFAKLYALCGQLFTSDNAPDTLADCIALADALAVTQGTFADSCETESPRCGECAKPFLNVTYSAVSALTDKIEKAGQGLQELSEQEGALLDDHRILSAFIKKAGVKSVYFDEFAAIMCCRYGEKLVEPLKSSLDLSDEKATGNQVDYVYNIVGTSENEWYLSLAENKSAPVNVRIKAIDALGHDVHNTDKLLGLYKTEKGKIKNAALTALARLDPPEAEDIFRKLTENYKKSYAPIICGSASEIFAEFVRKRLNELVQDMFRPEGPQNKFSSNDLLEFVPLIEYKKNFDDCYLLALRAFSRIYGGDRSDIGRNDLNYYLIMNIINRPESEYREMIERLHEKDKNAFFPAYFYMNLIDDPEHCFDKLRDEIFLHRHETAVYMQLLYYSGVDGAYYISLKYRYEIHRLPRIRLFESIPDNIVEFLCDTSLLEEKENNGIIQKLKAALMQKCEHARDYTLLESYTESDCWFLKKLLSCCAPCDFERLRAGAVRYGLAAAKHGYYRGLELISQYGTDLDPSEFYGLISAYVMHMLTTKKAAVYFSVIDELPMSDGDKVKELTSLMDKVSKAKGDFTETTRKALLSIIRDKINSIAASERI